MENNKQTLKWIKNLTRGQGLKMIVLIISNAIFSILSVVFAMAIKSILDGATNDDKVLGKNQLITGAILIGAVVVLQFVFRIVCNGLVEHIKAKIENNCRLSLFSSIIGKKYDKITGYHSGELINRLNSDSGVIADGVTSILPTLVSAFVRLISAIVVLVYLDVIFAVVFLVAGLCVFVVMTVMRKKLKNLHKSVQKTSGSLISFMQECIENLLAVKAFSVDDKIVNDAKDLQDENFNVRMRRKNYSVGGHAIYNMIFSAGYIFALIYGAFNIYGDAMTYGALSAILQLVNNVQVPFASISSVFPKYYAMIASSERLMEIEDIEEEKGRKQKVSKLENFSRIDFENVSFSYGATNVLKNVNLSINRGELVSIMGSSGIGKSTLLKLLLGVYDIEDGEISIVVGEKKAIVNSGTRRIFAYVPQQNLLFSGSILKNLTFINNDATKEEIEKALKICCLDDFIKTLPDGLNTEIGENGLGLSEGQIQRIAIARALLSKAPVLLLDESTSALDEQTELEVLQNLKQIDGLTMILISHKKAVLGVSTKNIKISSKRIVEVNS